MKKLLLTNDYLLEVNTLDKIEPNSWYYNPVDLLDLIPIFYTEDGSCNNQDCVKIVSHRPLNGYPVIDGLPLLPELKIKLPNTFPRWFDGSDYQYK